MGQLNELGAELLEFLGLKPSQAMVLQDRRDRPKRLHVYVIDPGVDPKRFERIKEWRHMALIFERGEEPRLH